MHHHTTWNTKIAIIVLECQHRMTQISLLAHSVPLPGNGVSQRLAQAPELALRRHWTSGQCLVCRRPFLEGRIFFGQPEIITEIVNHRTA
jgi:hypothetical protein